MPAHYRRTIFWIFILLFVITAPLLILYTLGYRYNWERQKIQETGVLTLSYLPKDATARLNEEEKRGNVPLRFTGLVPGRYTISLTKDGYHSWKKRLWIESAKTTFAEHMILWKKGGNATSIVNDTLFATPSPDRKRIAVVARDTPGHIQIIDMNTRKKEQTLSLPQATTRIQRILWSPRGKRLFVESANGEQLVFSLGNNESTPLTLVRIFEGRLEQLTWGYDDDDTLYGYHALPLPKQGYELIALDLFRGATQTAATRVTKKFPYLIKDTLLYRVEEGVLIIVPFAESRRAVERRLVLPEISTNVVFLPSGPDGVLTLLDTKHERLLLIDEETRTIYPVQETIEGVRTARWSGNHNRLVWTTEKELWLLDLEQSTRERMAEEKEKIHAIAWDENNEYVFYATNAGVNVIEIDNRDVRNNALLTNLTAKELLPASQGKMLWLVQKEGQKTALSALDITER